MQPMTAQYGDSVESAIARMIDKRVHRLWIVDGGNKPVGIVSMSDILKLVRKYNDSSDASTPQRYVTALRVHSVLTSCCSDARATLLVSIYAIDGRAVGVSDAHKVAESFRLFEN
jgi:CBS domain-containing protein